LLSADFYLGDYSSQSLISDIIPLAPSIVPNAISARTPVEMSDADVEKVVSDFAAAGERAKWAGFGNGYLLSQFNSAVANRRYDRWAVTRNGAERFGYIRRRRPARRITA
jgi:2,4-dienoyl-CoA reductase-like NADH-dependent reductase (Old Yellow Enzyme family)